MQHNRRFLVLLAIEKNVIIELQMEMIKRVSPVAMRRGWTLQQSGQVHVTTSNSDVVQGEIYGKETYYVQLKLDDFVKSSCTCSRKGYCLHMAAVFFQLYAKFEKRTELFLMQHQQMRLQMQQERRKKKQASDKKQQTSVWTQPLADISDRSSFRDWQLDFEKKFAGYFNATMQHVTPFQTLNFRNVRKVPGYQVLAIPLARFLLRDFCSIFNHWRQHIGHMAWKYQSVIDLST